MKKISQEIKNLFSTDERLANYKINLEGEEFIKYKSNLFNILFRFYNNTIDCSISYGKSNSLVYSKTTNDVLECIENLEQLTEIHNDYEKILIERNKIVNDHPELEVLFDEMDFWY